MIAQTPGGYNQTRTRELRELYAKSRKQKPVCHRCGQKLAFDRAAETYPTCEQCAKAGHAYINASGGREKNTGAHKGPDTVAIPRLFSVRTRQKVSRAELARRAKSDAGTIKRIEDGAYQRARPDTAKRLADGLGVRAEDLH